MSFQNKNIIIVGASKGLGRMLAEKFINSKANVALIARDKKKLLEIKTKSKFKKKVLIYSYDLFKNKVINKICKDIRKNFKTVDVIIHCLGGSFGIVKPDSNWDDYSKSIKGNLGIAIDINHNFIDQMIEEKKGNIIHIGSIAGQEAQHMGSPPYTVAKATVSAYTRSMGNYLAKKNIILSAIVPGAFHGKDNAMARFEFYKPEEYKKFKLSLPQGIMPKAKEYWELIRILSNPKSHIFCGSVINVDGGFGKAVRNI